ncbi:Cytochrome P450 [Georgenia satyanarayanai]|uniref:Cytochrome P450 n=1 Tax=Georgenia satyanarayanai TaxID=860221 RepID=A0A2Y9ABR1_9MICO|nr:cytochrome P450 [Georgenia satyanarayanai]PYG00302.1 cytochrome P450 [Georgenia satyanarayanai]SSA40688.1 Cytochrome P450 [Georgenia satyanarayanai]
MTESPTVSPSDAARALLGVLVPMVAGGAIARRPRVMGLAQRLDLDSRAVKEMQRLRDRYGPGPVQVLPGRGMALLLDAGDVHRVLNGSPRPFSPASREKRGALGHFQPEGVLVSSPEERTHRRPFNEQVLQPGRPVHDHGERMAAVVTEEVEALLGHVDFTGELTWDSYAVAWWRIVRRIVLGDGARDDEQVTDDLLRLRKDANWAYFKPRRTARTRRFLRRVQEYVDRAEPGSLAELTARTPARPGTEPHQQVPQWLFAADAGAWSSFRALGLLCTTPGAVARAREELDGSPDLPYLRAGVLESLRLWPTTPLILRDTTEDTEWARGTLAAGSSVVIFAPFFHRDERHVPEAHRFAPELWLRERTDADWPLVPFSGGPAMCPGRNVVLLMASTVLGRLLAERDYAVEGGPLKTGGRVPGSLSPFALRFRVSR